VGEPEVFMSSVPSLGPLPSLLSAGNLLRNFVFTYFPVTDWRRFISPVVVFGNANIADHEIEQKVVDSVGSYGYQLNRILDALAVLIREEEDAGTQASAPASAKNSAQTIAQTIAQTRAARTEKDRRVLYRLLDLADAADQAAKEARRQVS
jgi:hypothetical protein